MTELPETYSIHPACAKWPRPTPVAFEELVADLKSRGLLQAITLTLANEILDGKVRYQACLQAGVELRFETYTGDDPVGFTISQNKHRRHMTTKDLAFIGEELAKLRLGTNRYQQKVDAVSTQSTSDPLKKVAQQLGITHQSIGDVRALKKYAEPNVIELVQANQVGLKNAACFARHTSREEQRAADYKTIRQQGYELRTPFKNGTTRKSMSPRMKTIAKAKQNYSGPKFNSQQGQELSEKLHPLIKRLRHQSKQHITLFSPYELECIAFDMEKLLAQWTNTETPASVKQASGN
jgi:hypothetical protein